MLVSGIYPPDTGGPATFTQDFSKWLAQKNLDVSVITYTNGPSTRAIDGGVKLTLIHRNKNIFLRYLNFNWAILRNYKPSTKVLASGAFLEMMSASFVRRIQYTVKIPGDIVWERARNSGVTNLDINSFQNSQLSARYRLFRKLFTLSISRAGKIIVPSEFLLKMVANWVGLSKKIELVYNSIDYSRFSNEVSPINRFDVLTASRLVPWKGVDELIKCCKELDLSLGIAGEGPDETRLKELASVLEASVTFMGQIPKHKMSEFYSTGKIFVLNSSYEGLPHALIEAKASGLICVGRAGTGSEEVIRDMVDGMLVNGKLGNNLKETLEKVLSNPELAARFRQNAHEDIFNRFNQDFNFQKIYEALM